MDTEALDCQRRLPPVREGPIIFSCFSLLRSHISINSSERSTEKTYLLLASLSASRRSISSKLRISILGPKLTVSAHSRQTPSSCLAPLNFLFP